MLLSAAIGAALGAPPNWTGDYPPCERHSDVQQGQHADLAVRLSTSNASLAHQFRRALEFWSRIVDLDFHETDTTGCSIELLDGAPDLFASSGAAARSQYPDRQGFEGWVAFNPAIHLSEREMFAISVHEIGHLLGLPHNPNSASVMFFLELDDAMVVDSADLATLARKHKLRTVKLARVSVQ